MSRVNVKVEPYITSSLCAGVNFKALLENDKLSIERSALPFVARNMSVRSSFV